MSLLFASSTDTLSVPDGFAGARTLEAWVRLDKAVAVEFLGALRLAVDGAGRPELRVFGARLGTLPALRWMHVAVRLDAVALELYVDGAAAARVDLSALEPSNVSADLSGGSGIGPGFRGAIRCLRAWSRPLELAEVRASAISLLPGKSDSALLGAWPLADDAAEATGRAADAVVSSTASYDSRIGGALAADASVEALAATLAGVEGCSIDIGALFGGDPAAAELLTEINGPGVFALDGTAVRKDGERTIVEGTADLRGWGGVSTRLTLQADQEGHPRLVDVVARPQADVPTFPGSPSVRLFAETIGGAPSGGALLSGTLHLSSAGTHRVAGPLPGSSGLWRLELLDRPGAASLLEPFGGTDALGERLRSVLLPEGAAGASEIWLGTDEGLSELSGLGVAVASAAAAPLGWTLAGKPIEARDVLVNLNIAHPLSAAKRTLSGWMGCTFQFGEYEWQGTLSIDATHLTLRPASQVVFNDGLAGVLTMLGADADLLPVQSGPISVRDLRLRVDRGTFEPSDLVVTFAWMPSGVGADATEDSPGIDNITLGLVATELHTATPDLGVSVIAEIRVDGARTSLVGTLEGTRLGLMAEGSFSLRSLLGAAAPTLAGLAAMLPEVTLSNPVMRGLDLAAGTVEELSAQAAFDPREVRGVQLPGAEGRIRVTRDGGGLAWSWTLEPKAFEVADIADGLKELLGVETLQLTARGSSRGDIELFARVDISLSGLPIAARITSITVAKTETYSDVGVDGTITFGENELDLIASAPLSGSTWELRATPRTPLEVRDLVVPLLAELEVPTDLIKDIPPVALGSVRLSMGAGSASLEIASGDGHQKATLRRQASGWEGSLRLEQAAMALPASLTKLLSEDIPGFKDALGDGPVIHTLELVVGDGVRISVHGAIGASGFRLDAEKPKGGAWAGIGQLLDLELPERLPVPEKMRTWFTRNTLIGGTKSPPSDALLKASGLAKPPAGVSFATDFQIAKTGVPALVGVKTESVRLDESAGFAQSLIAPDAPVVFAPLTARRLDVGFELPAALSVTLELDVDLSVLEADLSLRFGGRAEVDVSKGTTALRVAYLGRVVAGEPATWEKPFGFPGLSVGAMELVLAPDERAFRGSLRVGNASLDVAMVSVTTPTPNVGGRLKATDFTVQELLTGFVGNDAPRLPTWLGDTGMHDVDLEFAAKADLRYEWMGTKKPEVYKKGLRGHADVALLGRKFAFFIDMDARRFAGSAAVMTYGRWLRLERTAQGGVQPPTWAGDYTRRGGPWALIDLKDPRAPIVELHGVATLFGKVTQTVDISVDAAGAELHFNSKHSARGLSWWFDLHVGLGWSAVDAGARFRGTFGAAVSLNVHKVIESAIGDLADGLTFLDFDLVDLGVVVDVDVSVHALGIDGSIELVANIWGIRVALALEASVDIDFEALGDEIERGVERAALVAVEFFTDFLRACQRALEAVIGFIEDVGAAIGELVAEIGELFESLAATLDAIADAAAAALDEVFELFGADLIDDAEKARVKAEKERQARELADRKREREETERRKQEDRRLLLLDAIESLADMAVTDAKTRADVEERIRNSERAPRLNPFTQVEEWDLAATVGSNMSLWLAAIERGERRLALREEYRSVVAEAASLLTELEAKRTAASKDVEEALEEATALSDRLAGLRTDLGEAGRELRELERRQGEADRRAAHVLGALTVARELAAHADNGIDKDAATLVNLMSQAGWPSADAADTIEAAEQAAVAATLRLDEARARLAAIESEVTEVRLARDMLTLARLDGMLKSASREMTSAETFRRWAKACGEAGHPALVSLHHLRALGLALLDELPELSRAGVDQALVWAEEATPEAPEPRLPVPVEADPVGAFLVHATPKTGSLWNDASLKALLNASNTLPVPAASADRVRPAPVLSTAYAASLWQRTDLAGAALRALREGPDTAALEAARKDLGTAQRALLRLTHDKTRLAAVKAGAAQVETRLKKQFEHAASTDGIQTLPESIQTLPEKITEEQRTIAANQALPDAPTAEEVHVLYKEAKFDKVCERCRGFWEPAPYVQTNGRFVNGAWTPETRVVMLKPQSQLRFLAASGSAADVPGSTACLDEIQRLWKISDPTHRDLNALRQQAQTLAALGTAITDAGLGPKDAGAAPVPPNMSAYPFTTNPSPPVQGRSFQVFPSSEYMRDMGRYWTQFMAWEKANRAAEDAVGATVVLNGRYSGLKTEIARFETDYAKALLTWQAKRDAINEKRKDVQDEARQRIEDLRHKIREREAARAACDDAIAAHERAAQALVVAEEAHALALDRRDSARSRLRDELGRWVQRRLVAQSMLVAAHQALAQDESLLDSAAFPASAPAPAPQWSRGQLLAALRDLDPERLRDLAPIELLGAGSVARLRRWSTLQRDHAAAVDQLLETVEATDLRPLRKAVQSDWASTIARTALTAQAGVVAAARRRVDVLYWRAYQLLLAWADGIDGALLSVRLDQASEKLTNLVMPDNDSVLDCRLAAGSGRAVVDRVDERFPTDDITLSWFLKGWSPGTFVHYATDNSTSIRVHYEIGNQGPLLRLEAFGFPWGIPMGDAPKPPSHIALVRSMADRSIRLHLDGVETSTLPQPGAAVPKGGRLSIGGDGPWLDRLQRSAREFQGGIEQFVIRDRALSAEEVQREFDHGSRPADPDIVFWLCSSTARLEGGRKWAQPERPIRHEGALSTSTSPGTQESREQLEALISSLDDVRDGFDDDRLAVIRARTSLWECLVGLDKAKLAVARLQRRQPALQQTLEFEVLEGAVASADAELSTLATLGAQLELATKVILDARGRNAELTDAVAAWTQQVVELRSAITVSGTAITQMNAALDKVQRAIDEQLPRIEQLEAEVLQRQAELVDITDELTCAYVQWKIEDRLMSAVQAAVDAQPRAVEATAPEAPSGSRVQVAMRPVGEATAALAVVEETRASFARGVADRVLRARAELALRDRSYRAEIEAALVRAQELALREAGAATPSATDKAAQVPAGVSFEAALLWPAALPVAHDPLPLPDAPYGETLSSSGFTLAFRIDKASAGGALHAVGRIRLRAQSGRLLVSWTEGSREVQLVAPLPVEPPSTYALIYRPGLGADLWQDGVLVDRRFDASLGSLTQQTATALVVPTLEERRLRYRAPLERAAGRLTAAVQAAERAARRLEAAEHAAGAASERVARGGANNATLFGFLSEAAAQARWEAAAQARWEAAAQARWEAQWEHERRVAERRQAQQAYDRAASDYESPPPVASQLAYLAIWNTAISAAELREAGTAQPVAGDVRLGYLEVADASPSAELPPDYVELTVLVSATDGDETTPPVAMRRRVRTELAHVDEPVTALHFGTRVGARLYPAPHFNGEPVDVLTSTAALPPFRSLRVLPRSWFTDRARWALEVKTEGERRFVAVDPSRRLGRFALVPEIDARALFWVSEDPMTMDLVSEDEGTTIARTLDVWVRSAWSGLPVRLDLSGPSCLPDDLAARVARHPGGAAGKPGELSPGGAGGLRLHRRSDVRQVTLELTLQRRARSCVLLSWDTATVPHRLVVVADQLQLVKGRTDVLAQAPLPATGSVRIDAELLEDQAPALRIEAGPAVDHGAPVTVGGDTSPWAVLTRVEHVLHEENEGTVWTPTGEEAVQLLPAEDRWLDGPQDSSDIPSGQLVVARAFRAPSGLTLSAWVRTSAPGTFLSLGDGRSGIELMLFYGSWALIAFPERRVIAAQEAGADWTHLAVVATPAAVEGGIGTWSLVVNGQLAGTEVYDASWLSEPMEVRLDTQGGAAAHSLTVWGYPLPLAELRRRLLNPTETPTGGPMLHWMLEGTAVETDRSQSGHDGVWTPAPEPSDDAEGVRRPLGLDRDGRLPDHHGVPGEQHLVAHVLRVPERDGRPWFLLREPREGADLWIGYDAASNTLTTVKEQENAVPLHLAACVLDPMDSRGGGLWHTAYTDEGTPLSEALVSASLSPATPRHTALMQAWNDALARAALARLSGRWAYYQRVAMATSAVETALRLAKLTPVGGLPVDRFDPTPWLAMLTEMEASLVDAAEPTRDEAKQLHKQRGLLAHARQLMRVPEDLEPSVAHIESDIRVDERLLLSMLDVAGDGPMLELLRRGVRVTGPSANFLELAVADAAEQAAANDPPEPMWRQVALRASALDAGFSVESWVKRFPAPQRRPQVALAVSDGSDTGRARVEFVSTAAGGWELQLTDMDGGAEVIPLVDQPWDEPVWTHVSVTLDLVQRTIAVRVDDETTHEARLKPSQHLTFAEPRLVIGAANLDGDRAFEGALASVRVWDHPRTPRQCSATSRVVLSGDEAGVLGVAGFHLGSPSLVWPVAEMPDWARERWGKPGRLLDASVPLRNLDPKGPAGASTSLPLRVDLELEGPSIPDAVVVLSDWHIRRPTHIRVSDPSGATLGEREFTEKIDNVCGEDGESACTADPGNSTSHLRVPLPACPTVRRLVVEVSGALHGVDAVVYEGMYVRGLPLVPDGPRPSIAWALGDMPALRRVSDSAGVLHHDAESYKGTAREFYLTGHAPSGARTLPHRVRVDLGGQYLLTEVAIASDWHEKRVTRVHVEDEAGDALAKAEFPTYTTMACGPDGDRLCEAKPGRSDSLLRVPIPSSPVVRTVVVTVDGVLARQLNPNSSVEYAIVKAITIRGKRLGEH